MAIQLTNKLSTSAVLTAKFGRASYTGQTVDRIESYSVETALDTDADPWSLDIGDPFGKLVDIFDPDSEIRVDIAAGNVRQGVFALQKGLTDTATYSHDGTLALAGRDLSAIAVDTTPVPQVFPNIDPGKIIAQRALNLGFPRVSIPALPPLGSKFVDGSESEWEFWYRLVRQLKMWIWTDADGTLHVGTLNYGNSPSYYLGFPSANDTRPERWTKISELQVQKNIKSRMWEVWIFGVTGTTEFHYVDRDPTMQDWLKRPVQITNASSGVTKRSEAVAEVQEQLFEGKVGELEFAVRLRNAGVVIKQNTIVELNVPTMGLNGQFFVVGVKVSGGADGDIQDVRLRQKKYALTRRVPADPILIDNSSQSISAAAAGAQLGISPHSSWGQFFIIATRDNRGGWPFDLFLGTLLSICQIETGFSNEREIASGGQAGPEWYPPPAANVTVPGANESALFAWKALFANEPGTFGNPFSNRSASGGQAGVGPMQLTDESLKRMADDRVTLGYHDEWQGGRWHPAANIWVAAYKLAQVINSAGIQFGDEKGWWANVYRYNGQPSYGGRVKALYDSTYKAQADAAVATENAPGQNLPPNSTSVLGPPQWPAIDTGTPDVMRRIINYAEQQLGLYYEKGATGPKTYDCSGLVFASYRAAGLSGAINGRQDTIGYYNRGNAYGSMIPIPIGDVHTGDMVFINNHDPKFAQPDHMAIYVGVGQIIEATRPGKVIIFDAKNNYDVFPYAMRAKGYWPTTSVLPR